MVALRLLFLATCFFFSLLVSSGGNRLAASFVLVRGCKCKILPKINVDYKNYFIIYSVFYNKNKSNCRIKIKRLLKYVWMIKHKPLSLMKLVHF